MMHENIMKRKSKKYGRKITAKQLLCSKRKLFRKGKNKVRVGKTTLKWGKTSFYKVLKIIGEFKKCDKKTDKCGTCVGACHTVKML